MRTIALALSVLLSVFMWVGCDDDDNPSGSSGIGTEAVVTHYGFDFSAGVADTLDYQNNDGETISWQPDGGAIAGYPNNDAYIWFRNSGASGTNRTRDLGAVSLSSVTSVDTTWDVSPDIMPLLPGHVIVAACNDGFVKFEVLSADTSSSGMIVWPALVRYVFSTTLPFSN